MERSERGRVAAGKVWAPVLLVAGVALGLLLAAVTPSPTGPLPGMGGGPHLGGPRLETPADVDVVLATVSVVLLVALLVVYVRVYAETGARFSLGLVVVFLALLVQSLATWPPLFGAFGRSPGDLAPFLLLANVFKVAAFSVLLYLSLE